MEAAAEARIRIIGARFGKGVGASEETRGRKVWVISFFSRATSNVGFSEAGSN